MKTPARGGRTHNLPESRQTRYLLRHIAAESNVLKDDNYETPRGSLDMRIAYLPIHLFRCVDERQVPGVQKKRLLLFSVINDEITIPSKVKIYILLCSQINGKTCDLGY